jgi:hypothetical protein
MQQRSGCQHTAWQMACLQQVHLVNNTPQIMDTLTPRCTLSRLGYSYWGVTMPAVSAFSVDTRDVGVVPMQKTCRRQHSGCSWCVEGRSAC